MLNTTACVFSNNNNNIVIVRLSQNIWAKIFDNLNRYPHVLSPLNANCEVQHLVLVILYLFICMQKTHIIYMYNIIAKRYSIVFNKYTRLLSIISQVV